MLCYVYKSSKKTDTYLYIQKKDDFSELPSELMQLFGTPQLVTVLNLNQREKLARMNVSDLRQAFEEKGFYLQLPPKQENLLDEFKAKNLANKHATPKADS